jgi:hypothetical protein
MEWMVIIFKKGKSTKHVKFEEKGFTDEDDRFVIFEKPTSHNEVTKHTIPKRDVIDIMPEKLFNKNKNRLLKTKRLITPLSSIY